MFSTLYPQKILCSSFLVPLLLLLSYLGFQPQMSIAGFFKWVDDNGTVHYADSPAAIPAKYRNSVEKKEVEVSSKPNGEERAAVTSTENGGKNIERRALKKHKISFSQDSEKVPGNRVLVDVVFNGSVKAPMIIDTGAPSMIISPNLAEKLGLFNAENSKLSVTAGGIGGTVPAILTIIDSVAIGGVKDVFVPTIVTDSISDDFEGLIGMDLVGKYTMTVDYNKKEVTFEEQPITEKTAGGHTRSWWELNFRRFSNMRTGLRSLKERIKEILFRSESVQGLTRGDLERALNRIDSMANDADSLFQKLDLYASRNSVPTHWRKW